MKICKAFRKEWEKGLKDRAIVYQLRAQANWAVEKGLWNEKNFDKKLFEYWVSEWCAYLTEKQVKEYEITREQIEAAKAAGYVWEWERFNSATRYRGEHSYGLQLKPKGRTALYKAYKDWKSGCTGHDSLEYEDIIKAIKTA